jgi:hypothetical protein
MNKYEILWPISVQFNCLINGIANKSENYIKEYVKGNLKSCIISWSRVFKKVKFAQLKFPAFFLEYECS